MDRTDDDGERKRQEIEDVIREEVSRRRGLDTDAIRRRQRIRRDALGMLRTIDEAAVRRILTDDLGLEPGSPAFDDLVRAWRAMQR